MTEQSLFWDDLAKDLEDPQVKADFVRQSLRIQAIDDVVNRLDEARIQQGVSKAALARAIDAEPAVIRRMFTAHGNPTLGRLAEVAAALGLKVSLTPLPAATAKAVTSVLRPTTKSPTTGTTEGVKVREATAKGRKPPASEAATAKVRKPSATPASRAAARRKAPARPRVSA